MANTSTEHRLAAAALGRINRATTLGELGISIAHELNHPIAAIVLSAAACSRWLAAQPPNFDKAQRALERIANEGRRVGEIVEGVRVLVNRQAPSSAARGRSKQRRRRGRRGGAQH